MLRINYSILAVTYLLMHSALHAEPLKIDGGGPRERITVTMDNAGVDTILKELSEAYSFDIEGIEYVRQGDPISASMTGKLADILSRLLRNRNHLITRSQDRESGIVKVVILDSAYGVVPAKPQNVQRRIRIRKKRGLRNPRINLSTTAQAANSFDNGNTSN